MNATLCRAALLAAVSLIFAPSAIAATVIVIEPDNYPDGTILNNISPFVTLSTGAFSDNRPTFDVRAFTEAADASTGTKVFAHAGGIPFWNTSRTFRMDFGSPPTLIEIDYIASGFSGSSYVGRLAGYNASGLLLGFVETSPLSNAQTATMSLSIPGIAYALAYPPADPFGDLDNLRITTTVPEPASLCVPLLCCMALGVYRRRITSRKSKP